MKDLPNHQNILILFYFFKFWWVSSGHKIFYQNNFILFKILFIFYFSSRYCDKSFESAENHLEMIRQNTFFIVSKFFEDIENVVCLSDFVFLKSIALRVAEQ